MHPTFVSDATAADVRHTIAALASAAPGSAVSATGERLTALMADQRLSILDHHFWTSPLAFWELPAELRSALASSQLIVSKGDANYRRLLGDRHWPFTTPFEAIMAYAPAPVLALRSLKSELAAGLQPGQIDELNDNERDWMVNGRWGLIQFVRP
jgi:hypothetical protein